MTEKKIDNRGSKSITGLYNGYKSAIVKEQRVGGSWYNIYLRCTLSGFEINYQVKILSNQINKLRSYTFITYFCFFFLHIII